MPRVNRTVVLTLLIASSSVFLLFQLYYYRTYVSKAGPHILSRTGQLTASDVQWQTVKKFLAVTGRCGSRTAAFSALTGQSHRSLCTPTCGSMILASYWLLSRKALSCCSCGARIPDWPAWTICQGEDIPLHFLFRLNGYIIQVVFLYERSGNYLWHGALRLKANRDRSFAPFKLLDFGRHAGAYDRPELVLTVLDGLDIQVPRNVSHFLSEQQHSHFLECRYRDARNFLQLYPDDTSPTAMDFHRKAKSLLHLAARTLKQLNIPFWLSSGTCLGWFRQCSIISYSRDVDIGIFIADFRWDIIAAFRDAGLSLKHKFGKVEDSLELSFVSEDVKLDIFFFYEDADIVWNGGTQAKSGRKFKYIFPRFSLCWTELLELKVRVPCETLDYVTANYGSSWSIPVRSWDWKSSPSNVQENGVWPRAEWVELIQVY
ncbi:unnamed protein product [Pleuronectes platessa]|uniref:Ribitol-5-phosphate transferase FKTN N-terminal domain-containing protein n=1 Tax=Pleuronectes platessa TaxID=8262 RepID=A0A9N7TMT9_PLEPL|nr:unnamed protein product [Pleuronectes platessa]